MAPPPYGLRRKDFSVRTTTYFILRTTTNYCNGSSSVRTTEEGLLRTDYFYLSFYSESVGFFTLFWLPQWVHLRRNGYLGQIAD